MSGAYPNFGHSGSKVSSIDRYSFAITNIEVPEGCDRRAFMVRSALATAIAPLAGNPIAVTARAPATAPLSGMSQNLHEKLPDEDMALIDLVILDMKAFAPGRHKRVTGIEDNTPVMDFARRLARLKRPMWLRYVLVPGLTDDPQEIRSLAEFGASLGVVERAEILPFHQMGSYKWERLSKPYSLAGTVPPSASEVDAAVNVFRECGLKAA